MQSDAVDFISALANARTKLVDIHLYMEKSELFRESSISLLPFSTQDNQFHRGRLSMTLSVDGDMEIWSDENKKAFGAMLAIRYSDEKWLLQKEYGWSGKDVGWDPLESSELLFENFGEMIGTVSEWAIDLRDSTICFLKSLELE